MRSAVRVVTGLAVLAVSLWFLRQDYRLDLDVYRIGVHTWLSGGELYGKLPETAVGITLPFIYPPIAVAGLAPLALIPFPLANVLLTSLTIALTGLTWYLLRAPMWLLPLVLLLEPLKSNIAFGQINVILMAMVAADCLVKKPRWPRGLLVGLAAALKLTPAGFVLFFILRRDYQAAVTAFVSFLVASALGFLPAWRESLDFWTNAVFHTTEKVGVGHVANQSILGVLTRFSTPNGLLWLAIAAAVITFAVVGMRRAPTPALALGINALAVLLVSPISWSHHWVWCVPLLVALWLEGRWVLAGVGAVLFAVGPHWWQLPTDSIWIDAYFGFAIVVLAVTAIMPKPARPLPHRLKDRFISPARNSRPAESRSPARSGRTPGQ